VASRSGIPLGEGDAGFHVVDVDVARRGRGTYLEYRIQMDQPGQTAGCRAGAERNRTGQLEFHCNDGWNDVRGRFGAAVLRVDQLSEGGGGIGAFYGDREVRRVEGTQGAPRASSAPPMEPPVLHTPEELMEG